MRKVVSKIRNLIGNLLSAGSAKPGKLAVAPVVVPRQVRVRRRP